MWIEEYLSWYILPLKILYDVVGKMFVHFICGVNKIRTPEAKRIVFTNLTKICSYKVCSIPKKESKIFHHLYGPNYFYYNIFFSVQTFTRHQHLLFDLH